MGGKLFAGALACVAISGCFGSSGLPSPAGDAPEAPICVGDPDDFSGAGCVLPWSCWSGVTTKHCVQPGGTLPDLGTWSCADLGGQATCVGIDLTDVGSGGVWSCTTSGDHTECSTGSMLPDTGDWLCTFDGGTVACDQQPLTVIDGSSSFPPGDDDDDSTGDDDSTPGDDDDSSTSEQSGCSFTQGYWKNHEEAWPVSHLRLGAIDYGQDELLGILRESTRGDASLILAHQLIAALLNVESGASSGDVASAIDDAQTLLSACAVGCGATEEDGRSAMITASATLDAFNNGVIGPGHCD